MSMGVSKTIGHHWIVASTIHVHCNSLKPILAEENKWARLGMALHFMDHEDPTKYQDMRDRIQLDERWFFLTCEKERYLLLPEGKLKTLCTTQISHHKDNVLVCCFKASL